MAFKPGELTDQVMIQTLIPSQTPTHGSPKLIPQNVKPIWCKVDFISANEQQQATGQREVKNCRIKTTWLGGSFITAQMQGRWLNAGGLLFAFTGIQPDPAKDELVIQATCLN